MTVTETHELFIKLVSAGLWENEVQLSSYSAVDWEKVLQLAEEQSVVGLVTAGLEQVKDVSVPQAVKLRFVGETLQIEQRNKEMNEFVVKLMKRLQESGVSSLVVKGQGVAQCYEKPLWRACGDVDLLLDEENYEKAKKVLIPIAYHVEDENRKTLHLAMKIRGMDVELHGRMPFGLSKRADHAIDKVIERAINEHDSLELDESVAVPNVDEHVFLVFTHYLHHFFIEGVGLRQICDLCRMLYSYRDELDVQLLESRVHKAGLMTEWKAVASMVVDSLGMPMEAMPFYDARFRNTGELVLKRVLKSGNFGHNNDLSYRSKYSGVAYKMVATWRRFCDFASLVPVIPGDALRFFVTYVMGKAK